MPLGFIAFPPGFLVQESELDWRLALRNPGPRLGAPVASLRCRTLRPGFASIRLSGMDYKEMFAEMAIDEL
jgi:hypothetical protein